jgi:hypothetical protein
MFCGEVLPPTATPVQIIQLAVYGRWMGGGRNLQTIAVYIFFLQEQFRTTEVYCEHGLLLILNIL